MTATPDPHPADALDSRLTAFELRLWRGLLLGRTALPIAIVPSVAVAVEEGRLDRSALRVWAALVLWTAASTPFLWPRLEWARRLPVAFSLEAGVLSLLLLVGFGTRQWHVVHSATPLIFCAIFVSVRAT